MRVIRKFGPIACLLVVGCGSSDPTGSGGEGDVTFTTWGEEFIEEGIPEDPGDGSGFVDGWSIVYERFLISFQNIIIADGDGDVVESFDESVLVDNTAEGVKSLVAFKGVPARAWEQVGFEVAPVRSKTKLGKGATSADKELMANEGYSLYVEGTATNGDIIKTFKWGFGASTRYRDCRSEQAGKVQTGIVVKNNASLKVELTTHGDHLFYDRLHAAADSDEVTSLRFQAIADADANDDGEVTLEELKDTPLDVRLYHRSGLPASNLGDFITQLTRSVGHFQGEGECSIAPF
jgi:hypothetical protein